MAVKLQHSDFASVSVHRNSDLLITTQQNTNICSYITNMKLDFGCYSPFPCGVTIAAHLTQFKKLENSKWFFATRNRFCVCLDTIVTQFITVSQFE